MSDSSQKHLLDAEHPDPVTAKRQKRRQNNGGTHSVTIRPRGRKKFQLDDYTIGIICALEFEMSAVRYMLDAEHPNLPPQHGDPNMYVLGELCGHNVVIACLLGNQGKGAAAIVTTNMARTFPSVNLRLLVGIGGGIPSDTHDIRLGDVVIGMPDSAHGGVIQYDLLKDLEDGVMLKGFLSPAPSFLRSAVIKMRSDHRTRENKIDEFLSTMLEKGSGLSDYKRPEGEDILFQPGSPHVTGEPSCGKCNLDEVAKRQCRSSNSPHIHYGLIASGDRVLRSAKKAQLICQQIGDVLCFEMEAAGILTEYPCLVIRGISDYADSHKSDDWQQYAAAAAAGCAKEILLHVSSHITHSLPVVDKAADSGLPIAPNDRQFMGHTSNSRPFSERKLPQLRAALNFEQLYARQLTIRKEHARTCQWLLESQAYLQWLDDDKLRNHHGVLWIKGKPGTGKSTLMKFALTKASETMKEKLHLSFFFNARGVLLEKSTVGMYRSLLWQLLDEIPYLLDTCTCSSLSAWERGHNGQWNVESLQDIFYHAIKGLGRTSVIFFIDALDECEEQEIREMLDFFERIGECAAERGTPMRILFSSRHYPHVTMKAGLEMILEAQEGHSQDIFEYVESKLQIGDSDTALQIRNELHKKSSGVFMWVVLVVQILNKAYDRGRIDVLRQKLRDIPGDLHSLFRDILARDAFQRDELLLLIQWVLFANEPLTPLQLYTVLLSRADPESISTGISEGVTNKDVERFILDCSKGLVEVTLSKFPRVQFIHESVRDFLLKDRGYVEFWPDMERNLEGQSHETLKDCCVEYMNVASFVIRKSNNFGVAMDSFRSEFTERFPFLEYAIRNLLYHADMAEGYGVSQRKFLAGFELPSWNELNNIFEGYKIRRHSSKVSLHYILAEYNYANLIRVCPGGLKWVTPENERYGPPLFAAFALEATAAVLAILDTYAKQMGRDSPFADLPRKYASNMPWMRDWPGRTFRFLSRHSPLSYAMSSRDEALFNFIDDATNLMEESSANNKKKKNVYLLWATLRGRECDVKLLLADNAVDPNYQDTLGQTPLFLAALQGHESIVRLLLTDPNVNPNVRDSEEVTALYIAAQCNHEAIVKLLIADRRIDLNARNKDGVTALYIAAEYGHEAVVRLLLADQRIEPGLVNSQRNLPLHAAAGRRGNEAVVKLLLADGRVNPNLRNIGGETPLHIAVYREHEAVVKLLLANSQVDPNSQNRSGNTPLLCAVDHRPSSAIVKFVRILLGDPRTDPNIQDNRGRTPLFKARGWKDNEELVQLLLSDKRVKHRNDMD